jgi:hypothetical protein
MPPVFHRCHTPALREEKQIMGRPLLPADQLRRKVETYLSDAERAEIRDKAQAARLSLATFIRKAALGQRVHSVPVINGERWVELARTTANLNAVVAKIHAGEIQTLPVEVIDELREQVETVRTLLLTGGEP